MSQIEIVEFHPSHIDEMDIREPEASIFEKRKDIFQYYIENADIKTVVVGKPIAVFGVVPYWGGVGACWAVTDRDVVNHKREFYLASRILVNYAFTKHKSHRLQTTVLAGYAQSIRWLKKLGFKEECNLHKYDESGEDHTMMAITR